METFEVRVWASGGPSVTGRQAIRGSVRDPVSGLTAHLGSCGDLQHFIEVVAGNRPTIVVADLGDPSGPQAA